MVQVQVAQSNLNNLKHWTRNTMLDLNNVVFVSIFIFSNMNNPAENGNSSATAGNKQLHTMTRLYSIIMGNNIHALYPRYSARLIQIKKYSISYF